MESNPEFKEMIDTLTGEITMLDTKDEPMTDAPKLEKQGIFSKAYNASISPKKVVDGTKVVAQKAYHFSPAKMVNALSGLFKTKK